MTLDDFAVYCVDHAAIVDTVFGPSSIDGQKLSALLVAHLAKLGLTLNEIEVGVLDAIRIAHWDPKTVSPLLDPERWSDVLRGQTGTLIDALDKALLLRRNLIDRKHR